MGLAVDDAGKQVQPARIDDLIGLSVFGGVHGGDHTVLHQHVGANDFLGEDHIGVANQKRRHLASIPDALA